MQIWVDADACPVVIKEILYRAGQRWSCHVILVANQMLRTPPSPWLRAVQVARGFDVADDYIVQHASVGDLVITADIPLAAQVLERKALVLTPRGERLDANSIGERLAMRDMMEELRSTGVDIGGPAPFSQSDRREFANALDRLMMSLKTVVRS
ncbi:YaiI/YqxD family protein [Alcaligenes faecalis]|uniref:YaiI/YqxD family protein n=1 Tax=Alcaligenes faecalis TaxID=511 RepID=UPI002932CE88|nr:YaiI/YqxD family protein [Alcaligenes faecalis]MDV2117677.1 YaiI/YqxD family protein [Alcaligenes faecalis]